MALFCVLILILFVYTTTCQQQTTDDLRTDETRGSYIVRALGQYHQDFGRFPKQLSDLEPSYLTAVPLTSADEEFTYDLNDLAGYRLCFTYKRSLANQSLCCYNHYHEFWECAPINAGSE